MAPRSVTSGPRAGRNVGSARDILKKRDKPLKNAAKKGKVKHTAAPKEAPPGYTFLPLGTPELSQLCKELSRRRGHAVYVVNAEKASPQSKISAHVHRIGYYFKSEVLESACERLKYIYFREQYLPVEHLVQQRKKNGWARIMSKHGMENDITSETPERVGAAIRELFPRMPEADLIDIVGYAWKEGRVGKAESLSLARRVQLATLARIRHEYTHYDSLLRAHVPWQAARNEVERACRDKIIEWCGEEVPDEELAKELVHESEEEMEPSPPQLPAEDVRPSLAPQQRVYRPTLPSAYAAQTTPEPGGYRTQYLPVDRPATVPRTRRYIVVDGKHYEAQPEPQAQSMRVYERPLHVQQTYVDPRPVEANPQGLRSHHPPLPPAPNLGRPPPPAEYRIVLPVHGGVAPIQYFHPR
ncbi:hypothetical protein K470DRAFT_277597 [Piedraia hortae CBS 480.64]|uniref:DUF2293 domain-containing protein n=1 Tax=Piedraia hortae CBS 480.64 TaxID=1314780 RepID=A0A6A7BX17_9PEZI|nr:hypothetical protein K470DRAFT_277597 [Piedraia hortae CBS 480.64]